MTTIYAHPLSQKPCKSNKRLRRTGARRLDKKGVGVVCSYHKKIAVFDGGGGFMEIAAVITGIRKDRSLTQAEFADKLFVTRQAVSRWENGETTPPVDTLKKISELYGVGAHVFFGKEPPVCQSCGMSLKSWEDLGTRADGGVDTEYCVHCMADGHFTHDWTVDEMVETNLRFLGEYNAENGISHSEEEARKMLKQYLPSLKRWKKD